MIASGFALGLVPAEGVGYDPNLRASRNARGNDFYLPRARLIVGLKFDPRRTIRLRHGCSKKLQGTNFYIFVTEFHSKHRKILQVGYLEASCLDFSVAAGFVKNASISAISDGLSQSPAAPTIPLI